MRRQGRRTAVSIWLPVCACLLTILGASAPAAHASGTWLWPISGPVIRGFDPPNSPFGSGHRGIDIAAPAGSPIVAPQAGTVTFAGSVAGHLFLTVAHGGGVASTYSWLNGLLVRKGDLVARGQAIALSGDGHPGALTPSLHMGVKLGTIYVDPLDYLMALDVTSLIRLAPL
jgi:murein DD-endopeptidase MepM/ murein hydrolase activator NlpD